MAWLCSAAVVAYVHRNSITVTADDMGRDLDIDPVAMGTVMSAFFLTYALFQLPTGWLAKRFGTRRALSWFAGLWSLATGATAVCNSALGLIGVRLLSGALQSGIFPCAVITISRWLPPHRRSLASGLLASCMSAGGALGAMLAGVMLHWFDWRTTFVIFAVPGIVWAVAFYWWFRDQPHQHPAVNQAERDLLAGEADGPDPPRWRAEAAVEPTPWLEILTNLSVWAICAQQTFRAAGYVFFATWFGTFLKEGLRVESPVLVGYFNSLPLWAVVIGSPAGGWIADWLFKRTGSLQISRQGVAVCGQWTACALFVAASQFSSVGPAITLITAGSLVAAFGGPVAYTATIDLGGRHVAMVFSLMNMAGNLGAVLFPSLVPWIIRWSSGSGSGWHGVIYAFAATYFLAGACWLMVDFRRRIGTAG